MVLNKLLDSSSSRRLQLVEVLLSDDKWWTIDELSRQLMCSARTIRADIQYHNSNTTSEVIIETSKQRGIKLTTSNDFQMEKIYQRAMENSLNFQIIKKLFELDTPSIEDLAEYLYTSISSIIRSLKQINGFLAEYGLWIQSKPVKIRGSEKQIRYFYSVFLWDYYSASFDEFKHFYLEMATTYVDQLQEKIKEPIYSPLIRCKAALWVVICLERVKKGYLIEEIFELPAFKVNKINQLFDSFSAELPFAIPKKDRKFMIYLSQNFCWQFNSERVSTDYSLMNLYKNIKDFIETLKERTGYTLENQEDLIAVLMSFYFYRDLFKGGNHILLNRSRTLLNSLNPTFYVFHKIVKDILNKSPDNRWIRRAKENKADVIFMVITYWKELIFQVIQERERIQLVVMSQKGRRHEVFLADFLKSRYPLVLKTYAFTEATYQVDAVHILLTDCQVELTKKWMAPNIKVIGIETIPSRRDWKKIQQEIDMILLNQQTRVCDGAEGQNSHQKK
ncbi:helix-turn-helix domain-containing protein [Carnobacterium mobile]|uniref:helix-turn-helix domain-containing protein n=1 Tax=Carnobacterium mobile TaxID=2750 RepID=UPI0018684240|nr:helix-turn-helix domain-containing protein [Carnobacterium mobile]